MVTSKLTKFKSCYFFPMNLKSFLVHFQDHDKYNYITIYNFSCAYECEILPDVCAMVVILYLDINW